MLIRCKYILFDLDGTLVDSTTKISELWRSWAVEMNLDPDKVDSISRGRTANETISLVLSSKNDIDEFSQAFVQREFKLAVSSKAILNAKHFLQSMPSERWGVVTSATNALAKARLSSAGLPIPKVLVTSDSVVRGKPSPDSYMLAAQLIGAQTSDCLVFEDSKSGISSALSAGMTVIQVNGHEVADGVAYSINNYEKVSVKLVDDNLVFFNNS